MAEGFDPNVIGVLEIGVLIAVLLHGIVSLEAYRYFINSHNDPRWMKIALASIWLTATAHIVCVAWGIYTMTITHYGLEPQLIDIPPTFGIGAGFGQYTHSVVQAIYAYRLYKFSGSLYIPIVCWAVSAYDFVGGLIFTATVPHAVFSVQLKYQHDWRWLIYSLFASTAFVDVVIAASLCYHLRRTRSMGIDRTARLVNKLVVWTIQTGLATSVTAVSVVVTFAVNNENNVWLGLYIFLTNLYPTALFALLNNRQNMKNQVNDVLELSNSLRTTTNGTNGTSYPYSRRSGVGFGVSNFSFSEPDSPDGSSKKSPVVIV